MLGKTQTEVKEKLQKALAQAGKIDFTKTGKYTVGAWMEVWFENVAKIKVRASSHQSYRGYIDNHIMPNIGSIPLEKLTTMDLQKFYRKLLTKGRVEQKEAKATEVYEMYYIELATGLHRGELFGLKWQDIDWKNGIIKVRRQHRKKQQIRWGMC